MITRITFDEAEAAKLGIRTKVMRDLGPLVVLAGPNGHGKSRHLDLAFATIEHMRPTAEELSSLRALSPLRTTNNIEQLEASLREVMDESTDGTWLNAVLLRYEPGTAPVDPDSVPGHQMRDLKTHIVGGSYSAAARGMHVFLADIAAALSHGTHPDYATNEEVQKAYLEAKRFNELLNALLGTTVTPLSTTTDRYIVPALFGRPFHQRELSTGQKILITWTIVLHRQLGHYINKIVLIDEPDVYMHPDVCIRAIEALGNRLGPHGQIWLATHSLPLIAHMPSNSLYFVERGLAEHAGSKPSRIWQSLLGGEQGADKLLDFVGGDRIAAMIRFCAESLIAPCSVAYDADDPQPPQVMGLIGSRLTKGERTRMLEIGTGRGRIASAVADAIHGTTSRGYFDTTPTTRASSLTTRKPMRAAPSPSSSPRVQRRATLRISLKSARFDEHADIVLLCNVLHEVPVTEWLALFKDIGDCSQPGATLMVVEDQQPRVGELPHAMGFLLLEENEWKALVGDVISPVRQAQGGRDLTAFTMPVSALSRATPDSLGLAIDMVKRRSLDAIRTLRDKREHDHRSGRQHAFFSILHVNATLAQEHYPAPRRST